MGLPVPSRKIRLPFLSANVFEISCDQTFLLEEFVEGIGGFALFVGKKMPVSINRCDDACMPQSFLDDCVLVVPYQRQLLTLDFAGVMISTPPRRNTDLPKVSSLCLKSRFDQSSVQISRPTRPTYRKRIATRTRRTSRIPLADESTW